MLKAPKPLKSDYIFYGVLALLALLSLLLPWGYAEKIIYSNSYPTWFSYDCTQTTPSSWSLVDESPANVWKYFGYYDGNCYATLQTFDLRDLVNLENTTSLYYHADTRSLVLNDLNTVDENVVYCQLYYFGTVNAATNLSVTPTAIATSYDCTETEGGVIEALIPFNASNNSTITASVQAGNFSQSFMVFPLFNSTIRSSLDNSTHNLAIAKFQSSLEINGDGFNCITIEASNWCNFYEEPWVGIKKALGEDYIGDWFYVFVFFPLPFAVFLISRNGAYAGFVCLPILLFINTIDQVVFEISLSLITLASAFGFYELIRKKLVE